MLPLLLLPLLLGVCRAEHQTLCTADACFTLHEDRLSFDKAWQSCVHSGGYLMTVRDGEEEDVLRRLLSRTHRQHRDRSLKVWIGLKLHRGDCVLPEKTLRGFRWVSGEPDSRYANWEREPITTCTEDRCARVHHASSGENHLKWVPGSCKSQIFYACKFSFKGMCKPLVLLGAGQISYTAPFSEEPERSDMQSIPLGTSADILCHGGGESSHYSLCMEMGGVYRWNVPGPFCKTGEQKCTVSNGGCEHLCLQDADEVRCSCKDGFDLVEDGLTCRIKDLCLAGACEHRCESGPAGYACTCPLGFRLDANQRTCSDVDECQSHACEHACVNTQGSYTCACEDGYRMQGGRCVDVDECGADRCQFRCENTEGGFLCTCPEGFHTESDGSSCSGSSAGPMHGPTEGGPQGASSVRTTVELRHQPAQTDPAHTDPLLTDPPQTEPPLTDPPLTDPAHTDPLLTDPPQTDPVPTDPPPTDLVNTTHGDQHTNTSLVATLDQLVQSRVLVCVLGSVVPLLLLLAVTLAIAVFRCRRLKKEAEKKKPTADGYCWVSSGLDPRLEKLYESILTDDL